MRLLHN